MNRRIHADLLSSPAGRLLQFAALTLLLLIVYRDTVESMVLIWSRSETFAHGFLVAPVAAWLAWRVRHRLAEVPLDYAPAAVPLLALLGLVWLLAEVADVQVVRQLALVLMIPALFLLVFGWAALRVMLFPLGYLLFAVPAGEALIPPLIDLTALMTVGLIRLTGIPVYWEGNLIVLPSGNWAVVEACSGVRYLIASVNLGVLFAWLRYRSLGRRLLFVAASIVVPILANGLRGFLIVMLGHLSGMKLAVGVDHLIYGWVFFGLIMFLLFWIGSRWAQDSPVPAGWAVPAEGRAVRGPGRLRLRSLGWLGASVVVFSAWPAWSGVIQEKGLPERLSVASLSPVGGWQTPAPPAPPRWSPRFLGSLARIDQWFGREGASARVMLFLYGPLQPGREMINSSNVLVAPGDFTWRRIATGRRGVWLGERELPVRESRLRSDRGDLLVWESRWVAGAWYDNDYLVKVLQALHALRGPVAQGAILVIGAPVRGDPEEARRSMSELLRLLQPQIEGRLNDFSRRVEKGAER